MGTGTCGGGRRARRSSAVPNAGGQAGTPSLAGWRASRPPRLRGRLRRRAYRRVRHGACRRLAAWLTTLRLAAAFPQATHRGRPGESGSPRPAGKTKGASRNDSTSGPSRCSRRAGRRPRERSGAGRSRPVLGWLGWDPRPPCRDPVSGDCQLRHDEMVGCESVGLTASDEREAARFDPPIEARFRPSNGSAEDRSVTSPAFTARSRGFGHPMGTTDLTPDQRPKRARSCSGARSKNSESGAMKPRTYGQRTFEPR
jgi:hypothetical protein